MRSFIAFVFVAVLTVQSGAAAEKKLWAKSFLNQKAPDLVVEKWLTKAPVTQGKFVLIDFWATWCGPCRKAIPELNKIHQMYGDRLVVIGISDEPEARIRAMKNPQIAYYIAMDTKARMKKNVGVTGIPHAILIDPQGIVRWEGYPLLKNYELTPAVVKDVLSRYSR
jgi:thiol-disulfide isomerase/thioredoxin